MSVDMVELHDAGEALERVRPHLVADPVCNNLVLTILQHSIDLALAGTYWIAVDGREVVGFALESPPGMGAVLTRMPVATARQLAATIATPLARVQGEAETAAAFAGAWTERHGVAGTGPEGGRFYRLADVRAVADAPGRLRPAERKERSTLVEWAIDFAGETAAWTAAAEAVIDLALTRELLWVWDDGGPVSMTGASPPNAGVTRVQRVYTPPELRGRGYATACVEHQSRLLVARGLQCVLYTQLSNPTSNGIYRRIGYEAIAETLVYGFG